MDVPAVAASDPTGDLDTAVAALLSLPEGLGATHGVLVLHAGEVVAEAYGPGKGPDDLLLSWSVAKSVTHALAGIVVGEGRLGLHDPAPVAEWRGDERRHITLHHLLTMTPGLFFREDYVDGGSSDVIEMLFGSARADMAAYAAAMPLVHEPGARCTYSSGTTNIVSRLLADAVDRRGEAFEAWMRQVLLDPLGIGPVRLGFDGAGVFVGSSFCSMTLRDWGRFGGLYLDGGRDVLPAGWAGYATHPTATAPTETSPYGAHWWRWPRWPGAFAAQGYEGQYVLVLPSAGAVVCRFGTSPDARKAEVRQRVQDLADAVVGRFG